MKLHVVQFFPRRVTTCFPVLSPKGLVGICLFVILPTVPTLPKGDYWTGPKEPRYKEKPGISFVYLFFGLFLFPVAK